MSTFPGFGEVAERLRRSTVHVGVGGRGHGSGVIVNAEGVVVTNAHVAAVNTMEVQLWDGTRAPATLLDRDPTRDLAVLRVPLSGLPAVEFADSDHVQAGELVMAVGNPLGFLGALTTGVVHAVGRIPGLWPMKWVQADVRLAPGNSGGPLADARGRLVGINTMVAGGLGLAVPSNAVSRMLAGKSRRASLGMVTRPVEITVNGTVRLGLLVLELVRDGTAEAASLMLGDILVGAGGRALNSIEDLERVLDGSGERVARLQFLRGDRVNIRTVAVRLGLPATAAA